MSKLNYLPMKIFPKKWIKKQMWNKFLFFLKYFFSLYLFATITRSHTPRGCTWLATCWRTAERRRCRETRMWLVLRFSCASGDDEPGIGFGVGMTRREETKDEPFISGVAFRFFSLSRSPDAFLATRFQAHRFPRESRLSSHLSPVTLSSFLGAFPESRRCPNAGISSLFAK